MLIRRIRYWLNGAKRHRDLLTEMESHIEEKAAELRTDGFSEADAYFEARRLFGNTTQLREASREIWAFSRLESLLQDLRYGIRMLGRNPGFTAVAILALSLADKEFSLG